MSVPARYCAIDFGTSNSAIVIPATAGTAAGGAASGAAGAAGASSAPGASAMRLVELEPGHATMPTAVFYGSDGNPNDPPRRDYGRAALAAYVEGGEGRLMRSMKSILGSSLLEQTTDVGGGKSVRYIDVVTAYISHLKRRAEAEAGGPIDRAIIGRPVFFVDGDPARDAQAEAALRKAAQRAGFRELEFQFEPIAAAFDYEQGVASEQKVLVADIGGGTSDFSVVRVGPALAARLDRKGDILANHGVHIAGTDFDRRVELASVMPLLGFGGIGASVAGSTPREVPSAVYFDLATWHLINTVYNPQRVMELRGMRSYYGDPVQHRRLMAVVEERLGHDLLSRAEAAKIAVAEGGAVPIDLDHVEARLAASLDEAQARDALDADLERIVAAARTTVADAGLAPEAIDALYFTGGSTGLRMLADRLQQAFPAAHAVRGDRFASVATGLGLYARRRFAGQP